MLQLNFIKEIKDIFNYLSEHTQNKEQLEKLKQKFKANCTFKIDENIEKELDILQNELAEIEEKRDDLTIKLAFLRRDLCELNEQISALKIDENCEKIEVKEEKKEW